MGFTIYDWGFTIYDDDYDSMILGVWRMRNEIAGDDLSRQFWLMHVRNLLKERFWA
jgi:hypothetical protein